MGFENYFTRRSLLGAILLIFVSGISGAEEDPCYRECSVDLKNSKVCNFTFSLTNDLVLSRYCGNCPVNQDDCANPECIPVDGTRRGIAVVNKVLPGPSIHVCEGDTVSVKVINNLNGQAATIHWHGIHQKGTPWMDGVPELTQCATPVSSSIRYEFQVPVGGTYFWHSHEGVQRADGIAGSLIVRQAKENNVHAKLYDYDLREHELIVQDWLPKLSLKSQFSGGPTKIMNDSILAAAILVNGKGFPHNYYDKFSRADTIQSKGKPYVPIQEFRIASEKSYRFRMISNGVSDCPIEMSVQNHTMKVIATDGFDVNPVDVNSLVIFAGERWDFILKGDQKPGSYWIKFRGLLDCEKTEAFQVAVLNYEGQDKGQLPPESIKSWVEATPLPGIQLNPLNLAPGTEGQSISISQLRSAKDDDPEIIEKEEADHQFYFSYDFDTFHNLKQRNGGVPINPFPQLNYITLKMPDEPPILYPEENHKIDKCNELNRADCSKKICRCTHYVQVKKNSIVEIVMVDRGYNAESSHPFHLHGHSFRVVAQEKLGDSTEPWIVKSRDRAGEIRRTRSNAPIKDTCPVPDGGYTIFRFRANNPGYWLMHCHIEIHAILGMGVIWQVGETEEIPRVPQDFPKCENTQKQYFPFPFPLPKIPIPTRQTLPRLPFAQTQ